jgi:putative aldouronate transport system substrate-binding protein
MRRALSLAAILVLLPAALVMAGAGGEKGGAAAAGKQATPVAIMTYMGHQATDEQWQRIHDYIEQQSGVKFTFRDVPDATSYGTQLTAAIAAQEPIDMISIGDKVALSNYISRGTIQDITDAVNKYGPNMKKLFQNPPGWQGLKPGEMWKIVTVNGKIWAIPQASGTNVGVVLQVRKDWREKLGLGPITTIDEYENYLRKVKATDLNGNGKNDEIPYLDLYGDAPLEGTASSLTYAFTGSSGWMHPWYNPTYLTPDGGIAPTILHPKFKDFLKRMRSWYADGLLFKDVLTSTWDNGNDLVAADRVGSITSWYSDFYSAWETLTKTNPTADYEIVVLKNVDGGPAKFTLNDPASPGYGFTAWSKNAPWGVALADWFAASKDNYIVEVHGVPNVDWKWVNKDTNEISKTDPKLYAYSFLGFVPWNGVPTGTVTFGSAKRTAANRYLAKQAGVWWPDWFIAYNWKDTPIEKNYNDASTFINEAISNYILGRSSDADWDKALAQYKTMWADEFSKQATAVFKASK